MPRGRRFSTAALLLGLCALRADWATCHDAPDGSADGQCAAGDGSCDPGSDPHDTAGEHDGHPSDIHSGDAIYSMDLDDIGGGGYYDINEIYGGASDHLAHTERPHEERSEGGSPENSGTIPSSSERPEFEKNVNDFGDYSNLINGNHLVGSGVPEHELPHHMLREEFDPTTQMGELYRLSSMETHADLLGRSPEFNPGTLEGDAADVEAAVSRAVEGYLKDANRLEGMRDFRACVIGSGDLAGIDMSRFASFEEVALADVDVWQTQVALSAPRYSTLFGKTSLHREDVTGILAAFRWKTEHIYGVVDTTEQAWDFLSQYISGDNFIPAHVTYDTGFNSSLRYVPTSDVVVVNMIFNQVGNGFLKHLQSEMVRLKSKSWGLSSVDVIMGLSNVSPRLTDRVEEHLYTQIVRKMEKNKNRKAVIFLSLVEESEWAYDPETQERRQKVVLRTGGADQSYANRFTSLGVPLQETVSAPMVVERWTDESGVHRLREQLVSISAVSIGRELSFEEWLKVMQSGNREVYS